MIFGYKYYDTGLTRQIVQINLFTLGFDRETRIADIVLLLVVIDDSVNYWFFCVERCIYDARVPSPGSTRILYVHRSSATRDFTPCRLRVYYAVDLIQYTT